MRTTGQYSVDCIKDYVSTSPNRLVSRTKKKRKEIKLEKMLNFQESMESRTFAKMHWFKELIMQAMVKKNDSSGLSDTESLSLSLSISLSVRILL